MESRFPFRSSLREIRILFFLMAISTVGIAISLLAIVFIAVVVVNVFVVVFVIVVIVVVIRTVGLRSSRCGDTKFNRCVLRKFGENEKLFMISFDCILVCLLKIFMISFVCLSEVSSCAASGHVC